MRKKSSTLEQILLDKRGYRTENYVGSEVRNIKDILDYEIGSLGNTDTLAYIRDNYDCLQDFKVDEDIIESFKEIAESEGELELLIIEEEQNLAIENYDYFVEQVVNFIKSRFKEEVVGLWLTTFEGVIERYGGEIGNIDCYKIPEEALIISDLDIDGALFVFPKRLLKVKTIE